MSQLTKKNILLKQVQTAIHALSPEAEIILYGSRAKGLSRADSDWDFLVLLPSAGNKVLEEQIKDCLYDIELETDTVLSSIIRSKQEWMSARYAVIPLRQEIEKYGTVI